MTALCQIMTVEGMEMMGSAVGQAGPAHDGTGSPVGCRRSVVTSRSTSSIAPRGKKKRQRSRRVGSAIRGYDVLGCKYVCFETCRHAMVGRGGRTSVRDCVVCAWEWNPSNPAAYCGVLGGFSAGRALSVAYSGT